MIRHSTRPTRRLGITLGSVLLFSLFGLVAPPATVTPLFPESAAMATRLAHPVAMPAGLAPVVARTLPLALAYVNRGAALPGPQPHARRP